MGKRKEGRGRYRWEVRIGRFEKGREGGRREREGGVEGNRQLVRERGRGNEGPEGKRRAHAEVPKQIQRHKDIYKRKTGTAGEPNRQVTKETQGKGPK